MEQNRHFWSILKIFTITFIYPKFERPSKLDFSDSWFTSRTGIYYSSKYTTYDALLNPVWSSISRDNNDFTYVNLVWVDALSCRTGIHATEPTSARTKRCVDSCCRISWEWKFWFCSWYSLVCNRFKVLTDYLKSAPESNFDIWNLQK